MVNYRRNFVPGGTFFFTVTLRNRNISLLTDKVLLLKEAFQSVKKQHPFKIKAYVILPEHIHMIWELPDGDFNYSIRWKKIKTFFSKFLVDSGFKFSKTKHGEYRLWQRRFWEHTIKDMADFENHVNYIHYNPIKHGLVRSLQDWPYSSFHFFVQQGKLEKNWGRSEFKSVVDICFGE